MIAQEGSQRQVASMMGRLLAGVAVLGIVWIVSNGEWAGTASAASGAWWSFVPEALRQETAAHTWIGRLVVGVLAGVLAKAVLPSSLAPGLSTCAAAGVLALASVASFAAQLGCIISPELSLAHLGIAAGATLLFILVGRMVAHF